MNRSSISKTRLNDMVQVATDIRSLLLADLALICEAPAPTFEEGARGEVMLDRFAAAGMVNTSVDDLGNVVGLLPGTEGRETILLTSNLDSLVKNPDELLIEIQSDRVIGPFVGDNSVALSALSVLPTYLERLHIKPKANLLFLASTRALKRGNIEGLRSFLKRSGAGITAGITLESVQVGRLNYSCMGILRGEIVCRLPESFDWARYGAAGTITPMSDIIQRIANIPIPNRADSNIILGQISGGITYNNIARETCLRFEVRSGSKDILRSIRQQIKDIVADVAGQSGLKATADFIAERDPGGIDISHPLVRQARMVIQRLGLAPQLYPTTTVLSALHDAGIPAITIGMAVGERRDDLPEIDESIPLTSIPVGLAQLAGILYSIDGEIS